MSFVLTPKNLGFMLQMWPKYSIEKHFSVTQMGSIFILSRVSENSAYVCEKRIKLNKRKIFYMTHAKQLKKIYVALFERLRLVSLLKGDWLPNSRPWLPVLDVHCREDRILTLQWTWECSSTFFVYYYSLVWFESLRFNFDESCFLRSEMLA